MPTLQQHLTIVTGSSRGLGRAVVKQRLAAGHRVLGIARGAIDVVVPAGAELVAWSCDLADAAAVAERLASWLGQLDDRALASATLINNAGMIPQPAPLPAVPASELAQALRVGLEAPLLLTAAFLRASERWTAPRKVVFVSSGLGRRAMAGSVAYCAAKAGLDHLARALALEEAARANGARVVSLAPGVIDTGMQQQLRDADPALFPERERFAALLAEGRLDTPAQAAARLLAFVDRADFGRQPVADVRDA